MLEEFRLGLGVALADTGTDELEEGTITPVLAGTVELDEGTISPVLA